MYNTYICIMMVYLYIFQGSIDNRELMERILKEHKIEIVISAVGGERVSDQHVLVEAIKAVGTVKVRVSLDFFWLNYICTCKLDFVATALEIYSWKHQINIYIHVCTDIFYFT